MGSFPYKNVLLIGAGMGIGLELAKQLVQDGVYIIATCCSQSSVSLIRSYVRDSRVTAMANCIIYDPFDIDNLDDPSFVQNMTTDSPDIDCIIFNDVVQYQVSTGKLRIVDIPRTQGLIAGSVMTMTEAFVPFLQANSLRLNKEVAIVYTTTILASIHEPIVIDYSAYEAMRRFISLTREDLKKNPESKINIVELVVPLVLTVVRDGDLDWHEGYDLGMPVKRLVGKAIAGLKAKEETVDVDQVRQGFDTFELEIRTRETPSGRPGLGGDQGEHGQGTHS
ncbi:hypothetical protein Hte_012384 [Hypoxylon texense]